MSGKSWNAARCGTIGTNVCETQGVVRKTDAATNPAGWLCVQRQATQCMVVPVSLRQPGFDVIEAGRSRSHWVRSRS